jgi:hypothetical protein
MSLVPYVAALVLSLVVVGVALTRVNTNPLHKDSD